MDLKAKLQRVGLILLLTASALLQSGCYLTRGYTEAEYPKEQCDVLARSSITGKGINEVCKEICCCLQACATSDSAAEFKEDFLKEIGKRYDRDTANKIIARFHFNTQFGTELDKMFKCAQELWLKFGADGGSDEAQRKIKELGLDRLFIRLESLNAERDRQQTAHQDERTRLSYLIRELLKLMEADIQSGSTANPLRIFIRMPGCENWQSGSGAGTPIGAVLQTTTTAFTAVPVPAGQTTHKGQTQYEGSPTPSSGSTPGTEFIPETSSEGDTCMRRPCVWPPNPGTERVKLDFEGIL